MDKRRRSWLVPCLLLVLVSSSFTHDVFCHSHQDSFDEEDEEVQVDDPGAGTGFHSAQTLQFEGNAANPVSGDGVNKPSPNADGKDAAVAREAGRPAAADFGWDEDEFVGIPTPEPSAPAGEIDHQSVDAVSAKTPPKQAPPPQVKGPKSYNYELVALAGLVVYLLSYLRGARHNRQVAAAWEACFASEDGIFAKNFSLLGFGKESATEGLMSKETPNNYKFYATGRRYCDRLVAILDLKCRQDLFTYMTSYLLFNRMDTLKIEAHMSADAMEPIVFFVGKKRYAKQLHKESKDLACYAVATDPPRGRRNKWPGDSLQILSESRELCDDLISEQLLDLVFGSKPFEKLAKYFLYLHFTDQGPEPENPRLLRFAFLLPPADKMDDISTLVKMVPHFIETIGRYKLSAPGRKAAEAARAKVQLQAFKEQHAARQEALLKKKEKKREEELAAAAKSPEAMARYEEKQAAKRRKSMQPKVKVQRM
eukprot:jgi/Mesvir1/14981/Mv14643-RA.1